MSGSVLVWARVTALEPRLRLRPESYLSILGLYWDNGKENGDYYSILGL